MWSLLHYLHHQLTFPARKVILLPNFLRSSASSPKHFFCMSCPVSLCVSSHAWFLQCSSIKYFHSQLSHRNSFIVHSILLQSKFAPKYKFLGFPQLLHANSGLPPRLDHVHFLPNPFEFIYSTQYSLVADSVVKQPTEMK